MEQDGKLGWADFFEQIDQARRDLFCSISGAWYRGHADERWQLLPTLVREFTKKPSIDKTVPSDRIDVVNGLIEFLKPESPPYLNLSDQQLRSADLILNEFRFSQKELSDLRRKLRSLTFIREQIFLKRKERKAIKERYVTVILLIYAREQDCGQPLLWMSADQLIEPYSLSKLTTSMTLHRRLRPV